MMRLQDILIYYPEQNHEYFTKDSQVPQNEFSEKDAVGGDYNYYVHM